MMYHVFETEIDTISFLNGYSSILFFIGSFFAGMWGNGVAGYYFTDANTQKTDFVMFLYRISWIFGGVSALFIVLGFWALHHRASLLDKIKKETVDQSTTSGDRAS